jgi:hypothetical protein
MTRSKVRLSAVCSLLTLVTLFAALAMAEGAGADPDDPTAAPPGMVLSLKALGSASSLSFYGQEDSQTVVLPVAPGTVPAEVRATVELPPNVARGSIAIIQDDHVLSRVNLPAVQEAPVVLPLTGVVVADNSITITLRSYLVAPEGFCVYDPTNPLRLNDVSVSYVGSASLPAAVADFLPPILGRLSLFIPPAPVRSESDAAVALAAALVAHYGQQPVAVDVEALPSGQSVPVLPRGSFDRQIVITDKPDAALYLQDDGGVPALQITGHGAELTNQTRLLTSNLAVLAVTSKAVAGPVLMSAQLAPDATTLRRIGDPGSRAVALTNPSVTVGIDQTRLGRPSGGVRVHLLGSYTPLPPAYGGQVLVSVGDHVIQRWAAESTGTIDRWVQIPDRLLQRFTALTVAVDAGDAGGCGRGHPITLIIDGDSPVQSTPATPPVPPGFQSLPEALMPLVQVGIGDDGFADTVRAVSLLAGMQRLSAVPLATTVVSLAKALASTSPAVLVSSKGWDDPGITLPVSRPASGTFAVRGVDGNDEPTTLTLDPQVRFGSLQVVLDRGRTLLVATSTGDPSLLDAALRWLAADPRHWATVNGNALIALPGRDPATRSR